MSSSGNPFKEVPSTHSQSHTDQEQDNRIEFIFIKMAHPDPISESHDSSVNRKACDSLMVLYSQFRIMQIVSNLSDVAILSEGLDKDQSSEQLDKRSSEQLKKIFPADVEIASLDFSSLSKAQTIVLQYNTGFAILLSINKISNIYQTQKYSYEPHIEMMHLSSFLSSRRKIIGKYPELHKISLSCSTQDILFDDLIPPELEDQYKQFSKEIRESNPEIFKEREIQALDCALEAAQKSGKKTVALLMGANHVHGITTLINTTYKDRIKLKQVIDSLEGYPHPLKIAHISNYQSKAVAEYKNSNFSLAEKYNRQVLSFWKAVPAKVQGKNDSILGAEFNLGSTLFKLAEENTEYSYEQALPHLEQASLFGKEKGTNKYQNRFLEAVKRHHISSSVSNELRQDLKALDLIFKYSAEEEPAVNNNASSAPGNR